MVPFEFSMAPSNKKQKTQHSPRLSARAVSGDLPENSPERANQQLAVIKSNLSKFDGKTTAALSETEAQRVVRTNAQDESEMGVIEEIYCENFMCHRKLRVTLGPRVNFITGENGSGKSAVIAAVQVC
ncbi:unnamed protein product [Phytophthora fragariaefolia]|uniref:Unnamed protein product n=1 Tax=Phytophthora fragariaefolia TaxID=1490495 RepID=A0A9W6XZF5_9STRA|nr:unnamed protein product [Phytophthora fragariaefolia]